MATWIIWSLSWTTFKFNAPVDVELGPDGKLYVLELWQWLSSKRTLMPASPVSTSTRVNIAPLVDSFKVDKISGLLPLEGAYVRKGQRF